MADLKREFMIEGQNHEILTRQLRIPDPSEASSSDSQLTDPNRWIHNRPNNKLAIKPKAIQSLASELWW